MLLSKLPTNTALGIEIDEELYTSCLANSLDMYPIKPPFYLSIYFFQAGDYLLGYEEKGLDDYCNIDRCLVSMEFKYFIMQLKLHDPRALALLYLDKKAYGYKDFYGRALLDNRYIFHPETYNPQAINKLTKEILYDYIISHYSK